MKKTAVLSLIFIIYASTMANAQQVQYSYSQLPLGSIKAEGWLLETLQRQRDGLSSRLDEVFGEVVGQRNGWLGGDGDQWERGPYWIDGLLPLAYILDDKELIKKVQPWIEWALQSQDKDGFFGPATDLPNEPGLQRGNARDWWPRMVMLKVMRQYYNATADSRVIPFLLRYFRYQLDTLPEKPLDSWTSWAKFRSCDNLSVVLWTYDKTGEKWLLDLADLLHEQGFDYTGMFLEGNGLQTLGSIHCVNLAQGLKEPVVYWSLRRDSTLLQAVGKGIADIRKYNGFPNGMYGGDECLHGNNPTQGSELCSAVELMYSMEEMMRITGDPFYAEYLEKIAFNPLPAQIADDFMSKQYYQQVNQIRIKSGDGHNFDQKQEGTALDFGIRSGYTCCLANFHQGWPKFVQNLWLQSRDGGLAALCYGPSKATLSIGGKKVEISEMTHYPFDGRITVCLNVKGGEVSFPLHFRIPSWARGADISVNGISFNGAVPGKMATIERKWKKGDVVQLNFPMHIKTERWYEKSVSVERGPLLYALKIGEEWVRHPYEESLGHGEFCWEVHPTTPWNYSLVKFDESAPDSAFEVIVDEEKLRENNWYWNQENCPISLKVKAQRIPWWQEYGSEAGPLPYVKKRHIQTMDIPQETVTLIPYGCTTLRIAEFPMAR